MTTALEQLTAAEAALATATADRNKLEEARARLSTRANDLECTSAELKRALSDRLLDVETGGTATLAIDSLRHEIAKLAYEKTEAENTAKACAPRIEQAKATERHAAENLRRVREVVAKPLADLYRAKAREAFAVAFEMHRAYHELAEAAGEPHTGTHAQFGDEDQKDSIPGIARTAGISAGNYGPHHTQPLSAPSTDALRALASKHGTDREVASLPPPPPRPVQQPRPQQPRITSKRSTDGFNDVCYLGADDGLE